MIDKKQKYIITLLVDNREWNSQPIEGKLGDLQTIIDEALEQHRISRFFTIRPKSVEFKKLQESGRPPKLDDLKDSKLVMIPEYRNKGALHEFNVT